jgi:hypothetical protein
MVLAQLGRDERKEQFVSTCYHLFLLRFRVIFSVSPLIGPCGASAHFVKTRDIGHCWTPPFDLKCSLVVVLNTAFKAGSIPNSLLHFSNALFSCRGAGCAVWRH